MLTQAPSRNFRPARRGFTLIEMMVTIGIIVLIAGILLPMIERMHRSAQITTMKLNLNAIATALEAYKNDFGDYPRNPFGWTDVGYTPRTDPTLAMALIGPGPYGYVTPTGQANSYPNGDVDGHDGPGFCTNVEVISATVHIV